MRSTHYVTLITKAARKIGQPASPMRPSPEYILDLIHQVNL